MTAVDCSSERAPSLPRRYCRRWLSAAGHELFRIGTGGVAGTYYPIGGLLAAIISSPPGARPCDQGGACGVPGLVAIVQSSNGSVANVEGIAAGQLESGFVQSDVAFGAFNGTGAFADRAPVPELARARQPLCRERASRGCRR